jgi:hypothetical protein
MCHLTTFVMLVLLNCEITCYALLFHNDLWSHTSVFVPQCYAIYLISGNVKDITILRDPCTYAEPWSV